MNTSHRPNISFTRFLELLLPTLHREYIHTLYERNKVWGGKPRRGYKISLNFLWYVTRYKYRGRGNTNSKYKQGVIKEKGSKCNGDNKIRVRKFSSVYLKLTIKPIWQGLTLYCQITCVLFILWTLFVQFRSTAQLFAFNYSTLGLDMANIEICFIWG